MTDESDVEGPADDAADQAAQVEAAMAEAEAEVWVTDCPLAALQFQQHAGVRPMHPMSVLARAYREDGFETKIDEKEGEA